MRVLDGHIVQCKHAVEGFHEELDLDSHEYGMPKNWKGVCYKNVGSEYNPQSNIV